MNESNDKVTPKTEATETAQNSTPRPTAKKGSKGAKLKAKLLNTYYGHPLKDMKLICVTGTTGKVEVAHFVYEILKAAGHPVELLASENNIKVTTLHKFLSQSWKAGANYVVVTAPAEALEKDTFYDLPVHAAVLTNYLPASLGAKSAEDYASGESILFKMNPDFVILNRDDMNYHEFEKFAGLKGTLTYGQDRFSNVQILTWKLYKKGSEANLVIGTSRFTVASFLTGEPTISYMAAAATVANALHITPEKITEGIANYDPSERT